ncbi:hypothetical protein FDECE_14288 [Fusarium decemcellulare]|nr:hypothetical protein FDECE_14288 [Fusarium decemcellulare]
MHDPPSQISSLRNDVDEMNATLHSILEKLQPKTVYEGRATRPLTHDKIPRGPPEWFQPVMRAAEKINARLDELEKQVNIAKKVLRPQVRTPLPDRRLGTSVVEAEGSPSAPSDNRPSNNKPSDGAALDLADSSPGDSASYHDASAATGKNGQPQGPSNTVANADVATTGTEVPRLESITPADSRDPPTLEPHQLGKHLPGTLFKLFETPGFANKARAPWIPGEFRGKVNRAMLKVEAKADVKCQSFTKRQDGSVIVEPTRGTFDWAVIKDVEASPLIDNPLMELERRIKSPPKKASYYCGLIQPAAIDLSSIFFAGEALDELRRKNQITHMNEAYGHLGTENSATPFHKEDLELSSCNIHVWGQDKWWVIINLEDTKKMEDWVRNNHKCKPCADFMRHLNLFFSPKQLKEAGIRFKIVVQRPGDIISTLPGQYHAVWNSGPSLAFSINFSQPGAMLTCFEKEYPVCGQCALRKLWFLRHKGFLVKWVDPDIRPPGPKKKDGDSNSKELSATGLEESTTDSDALSDLDTPNDSDAPNDSDDPIEELIVVGSDVPHEPNEATTSTGHKSKTFRYASKTNERKRTDDQWAPAVPPRPSKQLKLDQGPKVAMLTMMKEYSKQGRFVVHPNLNKDESMADDVPRLVLAILSRDAVKQFVEAVKHSKKTPEGCKRRPLEALGVTGKEAYKPMAQRGKQTSEGQKRTRCDLICNRNDQLQFAKHYQALRAQGQYQRLPSKALDEICKMGNFSRNNLKDYNKTGNNWMSVCNNMKHGEGLLPFIPCCSVSLSPFHVTARYYEDLAGSGDRLKRFHDLLDIDYVRSICAVAQTWFEAVDHGSRLDPEDDDDVDWDGIEEDEIVEQLKRLISIRQE